MVAQSLSGADPDVSRSATMPFRLPLPDEQRELLVRKATMLLAELDRHQENGVLNIAVRQQIMAELRALSVPLWLDRKYDC